LDYDWIHQIYNRLWVQTADISGVWGISFMIVLINVIVYKLILRYNSIQQENKKIKLFIKTPNVIALSVGLILLIVVPMIYGSFRLPHFDHGKPA